MNNLPERQQISRGQIRQKLKAFTLAEVLITLTIIGVVAAVTVPTLSKKTGNQETVARLEKAHSTLAQATDVMILENGSPTVWFNGASESENRDILYDLYKQYIRNSKDYSTTRGSGEAVTYTKLGGDTYNFSSYRKMILPDGSWLIFDHIYSTCTQGNAFNIGSNNMCAYMHVDLNGGKKSPNAIGRDVFTFVLKKDGLYPAGCDIDECKKETGNWGFGCACKVLQEGEINY